MNRILYQNQHTTANEENPFFFNLIAINFWF